MAAVTAISRGSNLRRQLFVKASPAAIDIRRHLDAIFFHLMRRRDLNGFDPCLVQTQVCEVIEPRRFAMVL